MTAKDILLQRLNKSTKLSPMGETMFQKEYKTYSSKNKLDPNPDAIEHGYDYRGQWKEGGLNTDESGHLSSKWKNILNSRRFVDGLNTITGKREY